METYTLSELNIDINGEIFTHKKITSTILKAISIFQKPIRCCT